MSLTFRVDLSGGAYATRTSTGTVYRFAVVRNGHAAVSWHSTRALAAKACLTRQHRADRFGGSGGHFSTLACRQLSHEEALAVRRDRAVKDRSDMQRAARLCQSVERQRSYNLDEITRLNYDRAVLRGAAAAALTAKIALLEERNVKLTALAERHRKAFTKAFKVLTPA